MFTHYPMQLVPGNILSRVKRPGRERNNSLQSEVKIKSDVVLPFILSWCLQKYLYIYYCGRTFPSAKETVGKETG